MYKIFKSEICSTCQIWTSVWLKKQNKASLRMYRKFKIENSFTSIVNIYNCLADVLSERVYKYE